MAENRDENPQPQEGQTDSVPSEIEINYRKTESYQALHVDGFVLGITPRGYINLEPYAERAAIPRTMLHPIKGKVVGAGKYIDGMQGLLRLVQAGLIMDITTAENLVEALNRQIDLWKKMVAVQIPEKDTP